MEGCEGPNGAFPRGALRRCPRQQARRCGDRLPISAERPQERGGPERGRGAEGPGASHQGTEQGQNRAKKLCATEAPPECKDRPGGKRVDPSVLPKAGPRRLAVPTALDALEAFLPQERKLQRQPRLSPHSELFLSLTCPTHPSGLCPSLHPSTPKLVPHPRVSRFLWALHTPRPAPSSIPSPSPLSRF